MPATEHLARDVLGSLRALASQLPLYPTDHPAVEQLLDDAQNSVRAFATAAGGEAVLTFLGDAIYAGREILSHASLEYNGLIRTCQARQIDSITLHYIASRADLAELGRFVAGTSDDLPAEGTIRLNERPFSEGDLGGESQVLGGVRLSYARSLDVLRGIALANTLEEPFDLRGIGLAVEQLVEQAVAEPSASLLLSSMRSHDEYTFYHSVNVGILSISLGRLAGLEASELKVLGVAALLHDIGKVDVASSILQHPGRLNDSQWSAIRLHPQEGAQSILAAARPGEEVTAVVAFEHHARFDGSGYPGVTYRNELHPYSRLVAVSDTYDAVTTRRSYRRAETPQRALDVLVNGSGRMFDPDMVKGFVSMLGIYPPGSVLRLADGRTVVVARPSSESERIEVQVVASNGDKLSEPEPAVISAADVKEQVTADAAGFDPATLL